MCVVHPRSLDCIEKRIWIMIMRPMGGDSTEKLRLKKWWIGLSWVGLLLLALFLRAHDLAGRPVHADEATGARILAQQLEGEDYSYNPRHFHGPTLSQLALPLARVRGEQDWSSLSITTLRCSTVIGGILLVLTPLLWRRTIGPGAALLAGAWLATSPLLVYYSRVYIHETWLALFGMLACAGLYHLALRPTAGKALATGVAIGLMFATKITVAISLVSWAIALVGLIAVWRRSDRRSDALPPEAWPVYGKAVIYLILGGVLSSFLLYSNYLQHPGGFFDALRSFFVYEPTAGHEKPIFDYAERLLWPKFFGGLWWTEIAVLLSAVAAMFAARTHSALRATVCFLGLASLAHFVIYSCLSYKTPWLMLLPWAQVCLLAGCLLHRLPCAVRALRLTILFMVVLGLGYQTRQALAATGRLENHEQNPYVYVSTSRDVQSLADWLESLNQLQPLDTIAVVGSEYWPLPWYLRKLDVEIHYWPDADAAELGAYAVVLSMPAEQSAVRLQLKDTHVEHPRSLRSNVPIFMFLDEAIWNLWIQSDDGSEDA